MNNSFCCGLRFPIAMKIRCFIFPPVQSSKRLFKRAAKPAAGDDPWMCIVEGSNYDTAVKDDKGNVISTGSTNPSGENAFTLMLGQYPATILEQAFKGVSSPIFVTHRLQHMFYMDAFHASISANNSKCFD